VCWGEACGPQAAASSGLVQSLQTLTVAAASTGLVLTLLALTAAAAADLALTLLQVPVAGLTRLLTLLQVPVGLHCTGLETH